MGVCVKIGNTSELRSIRKDKIEWYPITKMNE